MLSIIFAHTARHPFSEAMNEEIRSAGLRGDGKIAVTETMLKLDTHKKLHDYWRRKKMKASEWINDGASAPAPGDRGYASE
ncbi:hypothetical protein EVAR_83480_1 [Eumeta japonica]|uniref:Uncharacterized protein n=1 Tax=Eumeta variegata TaxID=151549 RepID=A0A4C1ZDN2_EUMVA|nr:hypothetical protein EVAR_83480_1 [Eumeta japonica]